MEEIKQGGIYMKPHSSKPEERKIKGRPSLYEKEEKLGLYGYVFSLNTYELGQIIGMIGSEGLEKMNTGFKNKYKKWMKLIYEN